MYEVVTISWRLLLKCAVVVSPALVRLFFLWVCTYVKARFRFFWSCHGRETGNFTCLGNLKFPAKENSLGTTRSLNLIIEHRLAGWFPWIFYFPDYGLATDWDKETHSVVFLSFKELCIIRFVPKEKLPILHTLDSDCCLLGIISWKCSLHTYI